MTQTLKNTKLSLIILSYVLLGITIFVFAKTLILDRAVLIPLFLSGISFIVSGFIQDNLDNKINYTVLNPQENGN